MSQQWNWLAVYLINYIHYNSISIIHYLFLELINMIDNSMTFVWVPGIEKSIEFYMKLIILLHDKFDVNSNNVVYNNLQSAWPAGYLCV